MKKDNKNTEEHHAEKAFRMHAVERHCKNFELSRQDFKHSGLAQKLIAGQADRMIEGQYEWCGRQFRFFGHLHNDGLVGWITVHAYTQALRIENLSEACSVIEEFPGFGPIIHSPTIPGREHEGPTFWGISVKVGDFEFTEFTVNMISASLDAALSSFENKAAA